MQLCILHQLHGELGCTIVPQINSYLLSKLPPGGLNSDRQIRKPSCYQLSYLACYSSFFIHLFFPALFMVILSGNIQTSKNRRQFCWGTQSKARWFCCKKNTYFCRQQHYSELDSLGLFLIITFFRKSCSWRQLDCLSHPFIAF